MFLYSVESLLLKHSFNFSSLNNLTFLIDVAVLAILCLSAVKIVDRKEKLSISS